MIRYLKHHQIDFTKWDDCIMHSGQDRVYARSWYLDMVSPGWEALADDDYTSVFPLTNRRKFGIGYLYPPFFTQQLGLFSEEKINSKKLAAFLAAIPESYRFAEINLNTGNNLQMDGFVQNLCRSFQLDLDCPYEQLQKRYSENLKRNLRKAEAEGWHADGLPDASLLVRLFRKSPAGKKASYAPADYKTLHRIIDGCRDRGCLASLAVKSKSGELMAGAFFLESKTFSVFLFSATAEAGRNRGALQMVIDQYIRSHAGEKRNLDFFGSNSEGLARFYMNFGASEVVYLQIKKNMLPYPLRLLKK